MVGSAVLVYACTSDTTPPGSSAGGRGGASGSGGANQGGESGGDAEAGGSLGGNAGSSGNASGAGGRGGAQAGGVSGDAGRGGASGRGGSAGASSGMAGEGGDSAGAGGEASAPVDVPTVVSGTRLRARVYLGSDGSRHVIGLHDSLLDIDCEFANLGPGGYRCVPPVSSGFYQSVFASDQCDGPATGYEAACGPHTHYVVSRTADTCDGLSRRDVFDIGAEIPSAYRDNAGTCEPYPDDPNASWVAVTPAEPSTFAAGMLEHVPLGDGLTVVVVAAEDGARIPVTLWSDGRPCTALEVTGAGFRCIPSRMNLYAFFADDTCTTEVGYTMGGVTSVCGAPPHLFVSRSVQNECFTRVTSVVEVSPFLGTVGYFGSPGACNGQSLGPSMLSRWTVGDAIEPTILPALSPMDNGSERLRGTAVESENGSRVTFTSGITDTEFGATCTPTRFDDGILRCLPSWTYLSNFFADANCTVPVHPESACSSPTLFIEETLAGGCSDDRTVASVRRTAGFHSGAVYQWVDETTCSELESTSYDNFYALEPMPFSDLVTLTETVE